MALEATTSTVDGTATVRLVGEADAAGAGELDAALAAVPADRVRRLVLDLAGLTYLSSAGLRCLAFAHQRFGRAVEIVLVDAPPQVAETIHLVGLHRSMVLEYRDAGDAAGRGTE